MRHLIGVEGPGAANPGSQFSFRDDVYPVSELPYRLLQTSVSSGNSVSSALTVFNSGPLAAAYTVTSSAPWLQIVSAGTASLAAQGSTNVGLSINAAGLSAGTYSVDLTYSLAGPTGPIIKRATLQLTVTPAVPIPALISTQIGDGTAQRSIISSLTLTFNTPVNPAAGAFTLARLTTDASGNVLTTTDVSSGITWSNPSGDGITWVIAFVANSVIGEAYGNLVDGMYRLTLHAADIANSAGRLSGGDQTLPTFFRLFGDVNGDGSVNLTDYRAFKLAYLSAAGDPAFNDAFDVNGDGQINLSDYRAFKNNYLASFDLPAN